ncbi:phosphoesterase [Candidatus Campbellbacteria bacterium CG10_big_fil_rev_8_21_14_0_10_35_52]|uniref:Phosphoesterase n=1 Tax=Candidatus Campbellbacteria bacterium CG10_big_fil_rev_8_21_14_0_10_35_52 TaxID=1974527 RepID=A0A2M6WVK4_9BACT|nr:MAG: phosphoesterase [Candidatus Campbellbacteria bacterium CG10_big_fil_rev_8_21_14_0_10_35_52]
MQNKTIIGIYHKDCTDGSAAAAVLLKRFPDAKLFPLNHTYTEEDLSSIYKEIALGADIYLLDLAFVEEKLIETLDENNNIVILDHHISAKKKAEQIASKHKNITYIFDNNKSGASLAWNYFFPDKEVPEIIKYVEDSDLWKLKYGNNTKYATNYLSMYTNLPETLLRFFDGDIEEIKKNGKIITEYTDIQIDRIVRGIGNIILRIGEFTVPAYNITMYESPVGNKISEKQGRATVMFSIKGNSVRFSFRSKDGQNPSALELAVLLGGGGHQNAAGAEISLKDFLNIIVL